MLEIIAAVADLVSATCKALIKYRNEHFRVEEHTKAEKKVKEKKTKKQKDARS